MTKQELFYRSLDGLPLTVEQKAKVIQAATDFVLEEMKGANDKLILAMWTTKESPKDNTQKEAA